MTGRGCAVLLTAFAFACYLFGQEIKTEAVSAFVWGEDSPFGAISSIIQDPLTGHAMRAGSRCADISASRSTNVITCAGEQRGPQRA